VARYDLVAIGTRQLLGVHVLGQSATELVHIGQVLVDHGGSVEYLRDAGFNYPTLAEACKVAALDGLNRC
jgi:NAD(P) transhydrogenase